MKSPAAYKKEDAWIFVGWKKIEDRPRNSNDHCLIVNEKVLNEGKPLSSNVPITQVSQTKKNKKNDHKFDTRGQKATGFARLCITVQHLLAFYFFTLTVQWVIGCFDGYDQEESGKLEIILRTKFTILIQLSFFLWTMVSSIVLMKISSGQRASDASSNHLFSKQTPKMLARFFCAYNKIPIKFIMEQWVNCTFQTKMWLPFSTGKMYNCPLKNFCRCPEGKTTKWSMRSRQFNWLINTAVFSASGLST